MASILGRLMRIPRRIDPAVRYALLALAVVLTTGAAGFTWTEGWDPWKSLFFTLLTITTVGYSDYGLSPAGERFAAIVMIGGIGVASYAATQIFRSALTHTLRPETRMLQRVRQMDGHCIICGFGRMGQRVARQLAMADLDFVVLDSDPQLVDRAREVGMIAIQGDATDDAVLLKAGVDRACTLVALTSTDAVNALICLTAHALAAELRIVARAEDESSICKMTRAGASRVVTPSSQGADSIAQCVLRPDIASVLFGEGDPDQALVFSEFVIDAASPAVGSTVRELGQRNPSIVFVASCSSTDGVAMRPDSGRVLKGGDVLILAGTHKQIRELNFAERLAA